MEHDDGHSEYTPPEWFAEALKGLYRAPFGVPPEVDAAVVARARLRMAHARRQTVRWIAAAASVAAGLLLSTLLVTQASKPPAQSRQAAAGPREDFNRDGRVDILDAFALARTVESRGVRERRWDLNGDGVIDRKDADMIAMAAVRIDARRAR